MGGLFSKIKTMLAGETILAADLNEEIDNIIANFLLSKMDDHSANVAQMQELFDPGSAGLENLPTNASEEVKALRSLLKKIVGGTYWYTPPVTTITALNAAIGTNVPDYRIISGLVDSFNQPKFLVADGASLALQFKATATDFVGSVSAGTFTLDTDDTVTVAIGPSTTPTADFNDTVNSGNEVTKYLGEMEGTRILLTSTGAEVIGRRDKLSAFKTNDGANDELFIGYVRYNGSVYTIDKCMRGFFFGSVGSPTTLQRVTLTTAQTIILLTLSYIFIKNDGTIYDTVTELVSAPAAPAALSINDFWFDSINEKWMRYTGAAWEDSLSVFAGWSCQDGSGNCIGSRSADFHASYSPLCDIGLEVVLGSPNTKVQNYRIGGKINVYGTQYDLQYTQLEWDLSSDLDTGSPEVDTLYFFYIKDVQTVEISKIRPFDRQSDLKGYYHPAKPFRCIGYAWAGGGTFAGAKLYVYGAQSYLSDHSIETKKLMPYTQAAPDDSVDSPNGVGNGVVSLSGAGSDGSATIITSGRPVLLWISPHTTGGFAGGINVTSAGSGSLKFEKRRLPDTTWSAVDAGTEVGGATGDVAPMGPFSIDFAPAGQTEYRATLTVSSGIITVEGRIRAMEI